jgi:hypothetical protein
MPDDYQAPEQQPGQEDELAHRFPEMRPIKGPPSLSTINGIGTMLCGSRDHDPETGTYVKTLCFTLIFIPLVALRAFRVADAPGGGWYFLGRVPLTAFAKFWNWLMLGGSCAALGIGFWIYHTSSPEYQAGRKLAEAEHLAGQGDFAKAAQLQIDVALGVTSHVMAAERNLDQLLDRVGRAAPEDQAAAVYAQAADFLRRRPGRLKNVFERGWQLAEQKEPAQPRFAMLVLDAIAPLAPDADKLAARQQMILEKLIAVEPGNMDYVGKLAVVYERLKQWDRCEKLLTPFEKRLGSSEGARILGQLMAGKGKLDQAEALLAPYVKPRLEKVRRLANELKRVHKDQVDRILEELRNGKVADFDFKRYERLPQNEQGKMVGDYLNRRLKDNEPIREARDATRKEGGVVPVAIDLGIIMLRRAQALKGDQRKLELEQAENTFLAVRGLDGNNQELNLNLAEVYYWLGKQAEGKKLLDETLHGQGRSADALIKVSSILRRVGALSDARTCAEEAYNKANDPKVKYAAADLRSVMRLDLDDEITWLQRCDGSNPHVKADLSNALASKAMSKNKDDEAARHIEDAIAAYNRMPADASTLNNGAMAYYNLYHLTGDAEAFAKALARVEHALSLSGEDSIILQNVASFTLHAALRDMFGKSIDQKLIKSALQPNLLSHLYGDKAGEDRLAQQLRKHPGWNKSIQHYERLLVLAPRNPTIPLQLLSLFSAAEDLAEMRKLAEGLRNANLDLERYRQDTVDLYKGKKDEKLRAEQPARLARTRRTLDLAHKIGGITLAIVANELLDEMRLMLALAMPVDVDEMVRVAEEADRAAPSAATKRNLRDALLVRAGQSLAKQDPVYRSWIQRSRWSMGESLRIALAMEKEGKLRDLALKNADVRRTLDLLKQNVAAFPNNANPWTWAMLQAAYPKEADRIVKAFPSDESGRLHRELEARLSPLSITRYLNEYWSLRMTGKEAQARDVLRRCAAEGIPLPFDVK